MPQWMLLVLSLGAFIASLLVPLFIVPQLLLRLGFSAARARLVGWATYIALITAVVGIVNGWKALIPEPVNWVYWTSIGAILFAVWWDVRRVWRRPERA